MSNNSPHKVGKYVGGKLPSGFREHSAVKVSVAFDDAQYEALLNYAQVRRVSFAEAVRRHLTIPKAEGK